MPQFTEDWSHVRKYWRELLKPMVGEPTYALEIGCFEGRATLWLLQNVLTHPTSRITVIDTFEGSPEHGAMGVSTEALFDRFRRNVEQYEAKIDVAAGRSIDALRDNADLWRDAFDFIYVDGAHDAQSVMEDAVLAWPCLKSSGIMVFDDYAWEVEGLSLTEYQKPTLAVDAFLKVYGDQLSVLHREYQVAVTKL